jgi:cytidylate kinase
MTLADSAGFVVAIDGPAGAGKSTVARGLARRLGYTFLDTGALYRTVAFIAKQRQIGWDDGARLGDLARTLTIVFAKDGEQILVVADGQDVTDAIRTPEISEGASRVSALPEVRAGLLDLQRRVATTANVVAEGRDVGTVVFPSAQAKFFLVATPETSFHPRRRSSSWLPPPRRGPCGEPWNCRPKGNLRSWRTSWRICGCATSATVVERLRRCAGPKMLWRSTRPS